MFCSKCGNKISTDAIFCDKCGAKVENSNNSRETINNKALFNVDLNKINSFGIISSLITIISVFLPCIFVTLFGATLSVKYIQGDGQFVLIIGVIAIIASLLNKNIVIIVLGVIDFIIYLYLSSNLSSQYLNILNKGIGYYLLPFGAISIIVSGIYAILKEKKIILINKNKISGEIEKVSGNTYNKAISIIKKTTKKFRFGKVNIGIFRMIVVLIIMVLFAIVISIGKNPGKFVKDGNFDVRYKFKDGHFAKNEWVHHNNDYYYFDKDEKMQKNKWVDNYYYVDGKGKMKKSCFIDDAGSRYYLKDDGKYAHNELIDVGGKVYAFNNDGSNIINDMYENASPSYICYVNSEGYVEKGKGLTNVSDGSVYITDEKTGALKTNDWIKNEKTGKYSFFDESGWLVKNKKVIGFEADGEKYYTTDTTSNSFKHILTMYIIGTVIDLKYYYVDENGNMVSNVTKTIDGIEWQFDNEGIGKKLIWKSSSYTDNHKKYIINKDYFEGQYSSSLYDKEKPAYLEICIDSQDVAFFMYEGENKRKVKNSLTYSNVDYECSVVSKSISDIYKFNGTMYKKGDRVYVDNNFAKTTIKNLLRTGENFLICIYEKDSYWDETYYFLVDSGNFAEIYNSTF